MTEQQDLLPAPRVERVTIGRLHNLGNYEHMRFEVTVVLPPGASPASVVGELAQVLNDVQPKSPVAAWALYQAMGLLAKPAPERPADVTPAADDPFANPVQDYLDAVHRREEAERTVATHEAWRKTSDAAMARFDQFGGLVRRTEAKSHWNDNDEG